MMPLPQFLRQLWRRLEGPKSTILVMSALTGLAGGVSISAINSGVAGWNEGSMPWEALAVFVFALLSHVVASYFAEYRIAAMVAHLIVKMRADAVGRIADARLDDIERLDSGQVVAMLIYDVQAVGNSVARIFSAIRSAVTVIFILVYVVVLSPQIALLAFTATALGICGYLWQERRVRTMIEESRNNNATYHRTVGELLHGVKELKLHAKGRGSILRRLGRLGRRGQALSTRADFVSYSSNSIAHLVLFSLLGLVAFLPPSLFSVSGVPVFQAIAVMLYVIGAIESVVSAAVPITRGRVALSTYIRTLETLGAEANDVVPSSALQQKPESRLSASGVELSYLGDEGDHLFTLGPIDLSIAGPALIFVTGGNGSGKTTLLKLLAGLYRPDRGEILLNGVPVTDETSATLRQQVAAVFSDFHLFDRLYGINLNNRRAEVEAMIEDFGLSGKVMLGPLGFTTTRLSTGQRKRLGLIAALLLDRPILILDEFGAEQDPEFRHRLYTDILIRLREQGKLVLAVTHDDRYFDACDARLHLDLGRIAFQHGVAAISNGIEHQTGRG
jgi:putative ATP-binding cassette transporter